MSFDKLKDCEPGTKLPTEFYGDVEQPADDVEFIQADDVFIKQMHIKKAGTLIPQHSHRYDHSSMLAVGSMRVWCDGQYVGDFSAPHPLFIEAGTKHMFLALEDDTVVYCIHNLSRSDVVEVLEENNLREAA